MYFAEDELSTRAGKYWHRTTRATAFPFAWPLAHTGVNFEAEVPEEGPLRFFSLHGVGDGNWLPGETCLSRRQRLHEGSRPTGPNSRLDLYGFTGADWYVLL